MKKSILLVITALTFSFVAHAQWVQAGSDINGEAAGDQSGEFVSLSDDGMTVAIGAPRNADNGPSSGQVRIYRYANGDWKQLGADINGETSSEGFGWPVSLSSDGNTVAAGARLNSSSAYLAGQVRIYSYNGGAWTKVGASISGEANGDWFGWSLSLNDNGNIVAIGAPQNKGNGTASGHVRIYRNNGGTWTQVGADINGEAADNLSGYSVGLSSDGNTVAIGAPRNPDNGLSSGQVRIYRYVNGDWKQLGADINGASAFDLFGRALSLSSDGNTVAIGAPGNDNNVSGAGQVSIYRNNGGVWTQVGVAIDGEAKNDQLGTSLSLSNDGNTVACGAPYNDDNGDNAGHVSIYQNNGGTWTKVGANINGEAIGDNSGSAVSLNGFGNSVVAIGAPLNDDGGVGAGHVRIYSTGSVGITEMYAESIIVYPNPTNGRIHLDLTPGVKNWTINIYGPLGVLVLSEQLNSTTSFEYQLPQTKGLYLIHLINKNGDVRTTKVVKE